MKNTIHILFTIVATMMSIQSYAQETFKASHSTGTLIIKGVDEATITAYDGNEVIISADVKHNEEEYERAKGLKVINSLGLDDNTSMGLSAKKEGEDFVITQIGECACSDGDGFQIQVPRSMKVEYSHNNYNGEDIIFDGISQELVVSALHNDLKLKNVTGPMAVKTVYGEIEAKFSEVAQDNSISINSVYGLVDVSLPSNANADLNLKTPYGQIHTNFDIKIEKTEGMRQVSSKKVKGKINNGGVAFNVTANYENIYLRKN